MDKTKTCKTCRESKPATSGFFYTTKVTKHKSGKAFVCLRSECKQCSINYAMASKHALGNANERMRRALGGSESQREWLVKTLGYCAGELAHHLDRQFTKGMTWEKFFSGEIHLDHIVAVCEFNKGSIADMRKCYALPNLRPAWASENLAKSGKRMFLL